MMIFILTMIICVFGSVIAGIGEALRIKDVERYSMWWHWLQFFERGSIFIVGALASLTNDIVQFSLLMILCAWIFFIIYDGLINIIAKDEDFFDISLTSKAFTEKFAHWYIKVPMLLIFFIVNFIVVTRKEK